MVILGLGSNLGDRLNYLRLALHHIKHIPGVTIKRVAPVYISDALLPDKAPDDWNLPYLNTALMCETQLEPFALLHALQDIERRIGRDADHAHWGPRTIDIDILAWDDNILQHQQLTIPHAHLLERPFALWPLADLVPEWIYPANGIYQFQSAGQLVEQWGSRFSGDAPFHTRQINQRIDTPRLMGILNITPDSFSDGGLYLQADKAYEQARQLIQDGAEILDIGAESTRPNAASVDVETEWSRLEPVICAVIAAKKHFLIPPVISIDTRNPAVARKAIELGVNWINDQTGCDNPDMRALIAETKTQCVIMHHLSIPERRDNSLPRNQDPVAAIYAWGEKRLNELEQAGIQRQQCIFDPGIGFGKQADQSLQLLRNIEVFAKLGTRVLIGHSRKSFFSLFTDCPSADRDIETAAVSIALAQKPIDYLRLHHVERNARALKLAMAI